jgi:hypothetical protein
MLGVVVKVNYYCSGWSVKAMVVPAAQQGLQADRTDSPFFEVDFGTFR